MEEKTIMEREKPAGSIVRVIDGVPYTVLIHFNHNSKETPKEKIMRMIKNDIRMEHLVE